MRARWYDPGTAQFVSMGRLVEQTQQPYSYANDNPLNRTVPTGLGVNCDSRDPLDCVVGSLKQVARNIEHAIINSPGQDAELGAGGLPRP